MKVIYSSYNSLETSLLSKYIITIYDVIEFHSKITLAEIVVENIRKDFIFITNKDILGILKKNKKMFRA